MKRLVATILAAALLAVIAAPGAVAQQCVNFARQSSGIGLSGDAWRWWSAAEGVYGRGQMPRPGAVLVFERTDRMRRGHVAVVSAVLDSREILVDHANWAPRRSAGRGKVARDVAVLDVSPANDWTQVRVWHEPSGDYGLRVNPTRGFVYPTAEGEASGSLAVWTANK